MVASQSRQDKREGVWLHKTKVHSSCFVHALSLTAVSSLQHFDGEGVFLVTAHVCITHEVESILVCAGRGRGCELQLEFGLVLQGQSFDGEQAVCLGAPNHHPPTFLALLHREKKN